MVNLSTIKFVGNELQNPENIIIRKNKEQKMKLKKLTTGIIAVCAVVSIALIAQSFVSSEPPSSSANDKYRTFVKTKNKCQKSNCNCSGYWGYKHGNGTYEGKCQNSDGHGHTCGHGPEKHGLKKW